MFVGALYNASIALFIPSSCGMFVYRDLTSSVARIVLRGKGVGICRMVCRKCVLSFMYEGMCVTSGCKKWSMYIEIFSVGESQPEMIGLPGVFCLCVLGFK